MPTDSNLHKYVFIFISSKTCSHCITFKNNYWNDCKKKINDMKNIKIVEIELENMNDISKFNKYPLDVKKYCKWYPSLMLVPKNQWDNGDKLYDLKMFNGKYDEMLDSFTYSLKYATNIDSILKWINNEIRNI